MTDSRCATHDQLLHALFDPACPRCHRADRIVNEWTDLHCLECGWIGSASELETFRREDAPMSVNCAWIILMACAGVLLGAAAWVFGGWIAR